MVMSILTKEQMRAILKEYDVKTADDINRALKDMFGGLLQEALEPKQSFYATLHLCKFFADFLTTLSGPLAQLGGRARHRAWLP